MNHRAVTVTSGHRTPRLLRHTTAAMLLGGAVMCWLALAPLEARGGDAAAGQVKAEQCAACHGADGISLTPQFPNLAGQHADYIVQTLKDYQSGARTNAVMRGLVGALSEQDMEDLAAFYASKTGLFTPSARD